MEPFQIQIVTRGKLIQLNGLIEENQFELATFMKSYHERCEGIKKLIIDKFQYKGNELFTSILFWIIITLSELFNLIFYSSNYSYQLSIIFGLLYTLAFSTLISFKKQIIVQIVCLCCSVGLVVLSFNIKIVDFYVSIGILLTVFTCLFGKVLTSIFDQYYKETPNINLTFQSNLLIVQFIFWKVFQIILNYYFTTYTFNYDSLILTIGALLIINTIKIYKIFDYEIFHVINIFKKNYQSNIQNENKSSIQMSKSINILIKQHKINEDEQIQTDKPLQQEELNEPKSNFAFQNLFNGVIPVQKQVKKQSSLVTKDMESYQSNRRLIITIAMSVFSLFYLAYTIIKRIKTTSQLFQGNIFWLGISVLRTTILLMLCQFQKTVQSQTKDLLTYMLIFICDFIFMIFSAFLMFMPSYISITSEQSFILSLSPFLTIKLFIFFNRYVHQSLKNQYYLPLFIFWLIPLSFRQIIYIQNISILAYIIDGIAISFALFVLVIWSNKADILQAVKQIKIALISKKNRLKLFQKLKCTQFEYSQILQIYIYIHTLFLNISYYYMPNLNTIYNITYLIIYCAPYLLYLLALIKCNQYKKQLPEYYRPSFSNILIVLSAIAYSMLAYLSILSSDHITWSLAILLNVVLFVLTLEGERVIVVYLASYQNFLRTLIVSGIFILIYLPFITFFASGYIMTNFSNTYLYYYAIGGFIYIWLIITIVGVAIHWILNLTQKSKKDLFIAQYMQSQMNKINMKEDIQKILMISSMYELFNYKSQELLNYLKSQKHMLVIIRKQKEYQYDYELAQPEQNQKRKLSIKARPVNMFDLGNMLRPIIQKNQQQYNEDNKNNPVLMYFQEKQKNKIEIIPFLDQNKNQLQLKRIASKLELIPINYKQIQKTQQYRNILSATNQQISDFMSKLYLYLTIPSKLISRQTFSIFIQIITKQPLNLQATNKVYDKFSLNSTMDQYKFKHFIIDYVNFRYQMKQDTLSSKLRTFCCRELVPVLLARYESFNYYLLRKKIKISQQSIEIWLKDKKQEQIDLQFQQFKQRQLRKKAKLLKKDPKQKKRAIDNNNDDDRQGQNNQQIFQQIMKPKKVLAKKQQKKQKQMKDKNFMKPQNVYSVIVNSLIECYLFYQKQADNFKIKTIKFSISNLLALVTKINDIVFVFGYSTIYLFIAYYNQDYSSNEPVFSIISYPILLILAVSLVLIYIILIIYHKKDFQTGKLGLDDNQRSLDFKHFKFYTISVLFLLGSGLANSILSIGLNSFICDQTTDTLLNFSSISCYDKFQFGYMLVTLIMILVIYWPLSSIIFPFSTAMNRDLEIKYKSQYQIIYLQVKLLINGFNTLLNPFPYRSQQFIVSIIKVVLCTALAILYNQMQPCSYQLLNMIQGKIYIILALLSFAGVLCYLIGLLYSTVATGSLLGLYIIYFIYITIKSYAQLKNDNQQNQIHQDNVKNQKLKIQIIKKNNQQDLIKQSTLEQTKSKSKKHFQNFTKSKNVINLQQASQIKLAGSFINGGEQNGQNKGRKKSNGSRKLVFM